MSHAEEDEALQILKHVILSGWPKEEEPVNMLAMPYYYVHDHLFLQGGIILSGK